MADLDIRKKSRVEDRTMTGGTSDDAVTTTHRSAEENYKMYIDEHKVDRNHMNKMDDVFREQRNRREHENKMMKN